MSKPDLLQFQAVLLDLDGTLYHEDHALPGAADLVARLQQAGIPLACISNSTSSSQRISKRLGTMGMNVRPDQIFTAAEELVDAVLETFAPRPRVFNLATEGMREMLDGRVDWAEKPGDRCDVVIAGTTTNVHATPQRQQVALELLRAGAELYGVCADRVYPSPRGIEIGCGAFCAMFSYAANRPAKIFGKPQRRFFETLLSRMHVRPDRTALIGDNLESDIEGGKAMGLKTILTLTGVVKREEAESQADFRRPDWIVEDLRELME
ncbi:MAG: HAD-IIA family hydrolase [Tepidisphaerales bacterium]